ncbi:hypothetical protein I4U23_021949 [Adineta vaga]|nr:hypothetical protein I4U23_021949 [Adineta vaga]
MLIPNYYELSSYQFKDLLLNIIHPRDNQIIQERFTNFTTLQLMQQRAQLMCKVYQLRIENDYWNYINNMADMHIIIWLSKISKDVLRQNSINWDYTVTQQNIPRCQQIVQNKLEQAEHNLNNHLYHELDPLFCQTKRKAPPHHPINIISNALTHLVKKDLHYFRMSFEQKKILFMFDINDAQFVKSFYDLNPTSQQILTARKLWQAKFESCQKVIHHQKKKYPLSMLHAITVNAENQKQQNESSKIPSFPPTMSTIVDARLSNMEERSRSLTYFFSSNIHDKPFF